MVKSCGTNLVMATRKASLCERTRSSCTGRLVERTDQEDSGRLDQLESHRQSGLARSWSSSKTRSVTKSCTRRDDPDGTPATFGAPEQEESRIAPRPDP